jgi:hypothetical protein
MKKESRFSKIEDFYKAALRLAFRRRLGGLAALAAARGRVALRFQAPPACHWIRELKPKLTIRHRQDNTEQVHQIYALDKRLISLALLDGTKPLIFATSRPVRPDFLVRNS